MFVEINQNLMGPSLFVVQWSGFDWDQFESR